MVSKRILGIRVDGLTRDEARQKVRGFLLSGQHKIFTPNPEFAVKAQKDARFREALNSGDLNLCDGMGLSFASGLKRIAGADFMLDICGIAADAGAGIYLLGSADGEIVRKTAENLKTRLPGLIISGFDKGPAIRENGHIFAENNEAVLDRINQSGARILFVAFGMGKQEKWICENLPKLPNIKIAMGVGGSFDYISGAVRRAPLFLRKIGIEWMYRLFRQPGRFGRIFNATFKFSYLMLKEKL